jgi:hypothetical protein
MAAKATSSTTAPAKAAITLALAQWDTSKAPDGAAADSP